MYAWSSWWHFWQTPVHSSLPERRPGRVRGALRDERVVLRARHDVDRPVHQRVLDAAELGAPRDVRSHRRLEPRVVGRARDRVVLAAEVGDPPRVVDVVVVALDVLVHDLVGRRDHPVDRDGAVRIAEQPVELVTFDGDRRLVGGRGLRRVGDARQLVEDERADHGEDHDRDHGPDDLEPRRAVDLRSLGRARPLAAAVLDDERDQRPLDEQEDDAGEDRDEDERVVDAVRVRRMGLAGQETGVACVGDGRRRERDDGCGECGKRGPAHAAGIV